MYIYVCVYMGYFTYVLFHRLLYILKSFKNIIQFSMVLFVIKCLPLLTCVVSALTLQDV